MPATRRTALAQIRRARGKTQTVVADVLGVSKATYSAWETGRIELTATRIEALADYFGCTPNDILGYEHPGKQAAFLSKNEDDLVSLYRLTPPNIKADVIDILRTTAKKR